jgi:hypothetical protein
VPLASRGCRFLLSFVYVSENDVIIPKLLFDGVLAGELKTSETINAKTMTVKGLGDRQIFFRNQRKISLLISCFLAEI